MSGWYWPLLSLPISILLSFTVSANTVFTNTELARLHAICAKNSSENFVTTSKKNLLMYHRDGYIPSVHFDLPDNTRADTLDSAAVVLCLEDTEEEIEVCNFNIFFSVARLREQYRVEAVPLDSTGERVTGLTINGPDPAACDNIDTIDNTVTSVTGGSVTVDNVNAFISANNLDREDNDRDGLRNLEEFKINSDPDDAGSPTPQSAIKINGESNTELFTGESAEIRLNLFPGTFLGNAAEYFFWADMPDGMYVFQYPAGFIKTEVLEPILAAPLVRLLDFRLMRLDDLAAGDYQFFFEARDSNNSVDQSIATLTVVDDPCRVDTSLPLSENGFWSNACGSADNSDYLAQYFSFDLEAQSELVLELSTASDAYLVLREGIGRNGMILDRSEEANSNEILGISLEAGSYTLEVVLKSATSGLTPFAINSTNEIIPWQFTEITQSAGIKHVHGYLASDLNNEEPSFERILQGGGVATGDINQDGWMDLYVTRGSSGANLLYQNMGDGTFQDVAANSGVDFIARKDSGAIFSDINGDGWPDLFLGGVNGTPSLLLINNQDGSFSDITEQAGVSEIENSFSASFADYDKDGDLDMYVSHWNTSEQESYLFQNDGSAVFTDVSIQAGIPNGLMADYTPIFSDINNDGWLDLLIAADFNTSQVYINNQDGTFTNSTDDTVITDDNGMGAAVGDYDNDGDIDWFVSSIFDPNGIPSGEVPGASTGATGNRLYRNEGNGEFSDVTDEADVRFGGWGWGSCFADFNNDGFLDIFHTNGYVTGAFNNNAQFLNDGSRLFISNQDGTFSGAEGEVGLSDTGQGRGIACFDFDLDGDIDIFVANNQQAPAFYRNDGGNDMNFLHIRLGGEDMNSEAIGARIYLTTGQTTQMREIYAGNNYISNNPSEAYFGVGDAELIDEIRVVWPSGAEKIIQNVSANQMLTIFK